MKALFWISLVLIPALVRAESFDANGVQRISVSTHNVSVNLVAEDRETIEVSEEKGALSFSVKRDSAVIWISASSEDKKAKLVLIRIRAPRTISIDIETHGGNIEIEGVKGAITAETHRGDVLVSQCQGSVRAETHNGLIEIDRCVGPIFVSSTSQMIRLHRTVGDVIAKNVSAEIFLDRITADRVEAETVTGEIHFVGPLAENGFYRFVTHTGFIEIELPLDTDATLTGLASPPQVDVLFPNARYREKSEDRTVASIGAGSARVEASTFSGAILFRPYRE